MATEPTWEHAQPDRISVREYLFTSYQPDCEEADFTVPGTCIRLLRGRLFARMDE